TRDLGMVPGNRVLLRAANNPMMVAAYFAVIKAGGVVVATMPLLRANELAYPLAKAKIAPPLCDAPLAGEVKDGALLWRRDAGRRDREGEAAVVRASAHRLLGQHGAGRARNADDEA